MPRVAEENQCSKKDEKTGLTCTRQRGHPPDFCSNRGDKWSGTTTPIDDVIRAKSPEKKQEPVRPSRKSDSARLEQLAHALESEKYPHLRKGVLDALKKQNEKGIIADDQYKRLKKLLKEKGDDD